MLVSANLSVCGAGGTLKINGVGVQKAQISRMERGYSISIPSMSRVFKALGITTATLDLGAAGKVALW